MSRKLNICILGTRGIPNRYGGFEQCAEYLALGLTARGHIVSVYNSHNHEYQERTWRGIHIIHCKDPESRLGTMGQFIYDLHCINDARTRNFDIVLQLGYTSSSIWHWRWPKAAKNIINMDGLEWKRTKYNNYTKLFLRYAEKLAAKHGDLLIADSLGIKDYLHATYNKGSVFIPYGAEAMDNPDETILASFSLQPFAYNMLIARLEPENNIQVIIEGQLQSNTKMPLLIVGSTSNKFGTALLKKYGGHDNIVFAGSIYEKKIIDTLRYFSQIYFHGHSVGGTNPSLLEAMTCNALIVAHDNIFNKTILGNDAFYFSNSSDINTIITQVTDKKLFTSFLEANAKKIQTTFNWQNIVNEYEKVMLS